MKAKASIVARLDLADAGEFFGNRSERSKAAVCLTRLPRSLMSDLKAFAELSIPVIAGKLKTRSSNQIFAATPCAASQAFSRSVRSAQQLRRFVMTPQQTAFATAGSAALRMQIKFVFAIRK